MTDEQKEAIINSLIKILEGGSIDSNFVRLVINRLYTLSYSPTLDDCFTIAFEIQKIESTIKGSCNRRSMPQSLFFVGADMVCGEFLMNKKQMGKLQNFDLEVAVKQIQTGDTNVTYAVEKSSSTEQRLDIFFNHLINSGKGEFLSYRKLTW